MLIDSQSTKLNSHNSGTVDSQTNFKKVILCATQRCGSTLVCNDFRSNEIGKPEEHFLNLINNPNLSNSQQILDNIWHLGLNEHNVFSVKLMSNYSTKINDILVGLGYGKNSQSFWSGIADYFNDAVWVYIQRESPVRQALSRLMSRKTGINHAVADKLGQFLPGNSMIGYDKAYNQDVQYHSKDINQDIVNIARENFQWSRFFQENKIKPLKISYENIVDDISYISCVRKVAGLAEQSPINQRTLLKLANDNTEKIIHSFMEEKPMTTNSRIDVSSHLESNQELVESLAEVTKRWIDTPYYNNVENVAKQQWETMIYPFIQDFPIDFGNVLELAVGHGRITNILLEIAHQVIGVDILQENIDFCANRFQNRSNLKLIKNDGATLKAVADNSVSFIICFDSMMHFDSDVIRIYLGEFKRILKPGGFGFLHHSNFDNNPGGDFNRAPHARNFMTEKLFKHYAIKSGLTIAKSQVIGWGQGKNHFPDHDCFSLIKKSN